jgi:hypothetical protein
VEFVPEAGTEPPATRLSEEVPAGATEEQRAQWRYPQSSRKMKQRFSNFR